MACVQSALMLLIGFAFLRGAAIGGLSLVSQQVVNLWFVRRRGIAAAAASLGLAAGSMVFTATNRFTHIAVRLERRLSSTCRICRADHSAGAALLFRDRPEKFGLRPDAGLALAAEEPRPEPSFSRQQGLRTGVFWLLCAAGFLTNAVGTALLLNHFSIMQTAGVAYMDALTLLALAGGVQAVATIGDGFLVDRYEPRRLVPLAMGMLALACALPAFGGGVAVSWLYALSLGGAYGSQQAINAAGYAQYFGRDHLGAMGGRVALRRRWRHWVRLHITGMGLSYTLMLMAFYVDNEKATAALEGIATFHVLGDTSRNRHSAHRTRAALASAGASAHRGFQLIRPDATRSADSALNRPTCASCSQA